MAENLPPQDPRVTRFSAIFCLHICLHIWPPIFFLFYFGTPPLALTVSVDAHPYLSDPFAAALPPRDRHLSMLPLICVSRRELNGDEDDGDGKN